MESNTPVLAKRTWHIIRVAFFMLRKGISKGKLMTHLDLMLKRRTKLAGKAAANLVLHHHHHHDTRLQFSAAREYEFSCANTPANNFFNKLHRHNPFFTCSHAPPTLDDDNAATLAVFRGVLEMLNNESAALEASPPPSVARQLIRVTDSPFPLRDSDDDKDHQVDKDAEEFIKRFYNQLKNQT
ncbi:hypothetical protein Fmac_012481 [Flemingia macrophylla]|uniref:Avr9/Cf-9 rapidly elicited protein n=1 Tax=Flemingia macrophylla TaxID=520843 RepID=A0ABD1MQF4_9FABA